MIMPVPVIRIKLPRRLAHSIKMKLMILFVWCLILNAKAAGKPNITGTPSVAPMIVNTTLIPGATLATRRQRVKRPTVIP